jgi:solute carrier family 25 carnitine/acylcarnitine transporter 20/29
MADTKAEESIDAITVSAGKSEAMSKLHRRNDEPQSTITLSHPKQPSKQELADQVDTGDSENEITAFHDLVAGGVAGSASVIVGHPFDTLKVRMQTSSAASSASLLAMASTFGGFSSLFRGMAAPLSAAAVVNSIIFASYGASSRLWDSYVIESNIINNLAPSPHDSWQKATVCGGFAGFAQCIVICPMEHIKCRLQIQHGKGANDYLYKGPLHAFREISRTHGIQGVYRGWWTTSLREVPAFAMYFATYDYVKDRVNSFLAAQAGIDHSLQPTSAFPQHTHTWIASAFAGGVSGSLTWGIIYPVDVIKTRIQTAPFNTPPSELRFLAVGKAIVAKQGWKSLWRGLNVTLLRAFPVNGIIFPVYEFTLMHINNF